MMKSLDKNPGSLFNALEAGGWVWENGCLYAPNKTFWIEGTKSQSTPLGMLLNMRERMKGVLESLRASKPAHLSTEQYQDWVSDMENLVDTIQEVLEDQNAQ